MRKPSSRALCLLLVLFVGSSCWPLFAAWVPEGPFGGHALKIVLDPSNPNRMWVTTKNGRIYHSEDGAQNWTSLPLILGENAALNAIALNPKNSEEIFLGVAEDSLVSNSSNSIGGVYKTIDGGKTWAMLDKTLHWPVLSLAVHPKQPEIVVAGTLDGVYRSLDSGTNWQRISPPRHPDLKGVVSLALDPENINIIYAGTPHLPWRTMDGGENWKSIHQGMIDDSDVFSIAVDRTNPERVYASACSGIYRTSSRGEQWVKMQGIPGTNRRTHLILQDPMDERILYAGTTQGLWKSQDGGLVWQKVNPYPYVINSLVIDPRDHNVLYLATDRSGVLRTSDGGKKFESMNNGFINRNISRFIAGETLYLSSLYDGDFGGIFSSWDQGKTWNLKASQTALQGRNVISMSVSPNSPGVIFAGTYEGLLRSDDAGKTWRNSNGEAGVVSTQSSSRQPAMSSRYAKRVPIRYVQIPTAKIYEVAFSKSSPPILYAATSQGLFESADEGKRWTQTSGVGTKKAIYKIVFNPADKQWIGVLTADGILISKDQGKTWERASLQIGDYQILDIALVSSGPIEILAATSRGLYVSRDAGKNWELSDGELKNYPISQILVSSSDPSDLYLLSTHNNQIFHSIDAGKSWSRFDTKGLETVRLLGIAASSREPGRIYALSESQGVFSYIPQ